MTNEVENLKNDFESIQNEIKNKFRLPIFLTYSVILIIYNWDVIFYLAFENEKALIKINYVKIFFINENFQRIWKPILYAMLYSIVFPFLQLLINLIVQFSKNINNKILRKEELDNANHKFNIQQQLTGRQSLEQLQIRIDQLLVENEKLISTNNSLLSQVKNDSSEILDVNSIFNSEYEKTAKEILEEVNKLNNEEKSAFIDVLAAFENTTNYVEIGQINAKAVFPKHTKKALEILIKRNIIEPHPTSSQYYKVNSFGGKLIKYFKSNYVK